MGDEKSHGDGEKAVRRQSEVQASGNRKWKVG